MDAHAWVWCIHHRKNCCPMLYRSISSIQCIIIPPPPYLALPISIHVSRLLCILCTFMQEYIINARDSKDLGLSSQQNRDFQLTRWGSWGWSFIGCHSFILLDLVRYILNICSFGFNCSQLMHLFLLLCWTWPNRTTYIPCPRDRNTCPIWASRSPYLLTIYAKHCHP